ncbi:MAG TPA: tetratricopeptide repeat protein [Rhizomicrobium sp.]|jgi:tetratricopeptide (TPR) repeat protein|nr:tetratricopeptide repeat protein [Rhizomicrobium sp.]
MRMRSVLAFAVGLVLLPAAAAADAAATPVAAVRPWQSAGAVLAATIADVNASDIRAVERHLADLEQALAGAKDAVLATRPATGDLTVLTDGTADVLMSLTAASLAAKKSGSAQNAVAVNDPYPLIALYLGSYYDEIGKPDDAARVLDAGLAIYGMDGYISPLGEHKSWLMLERSAASNSLKRFDDTLAITDKGIAMTGQPVQIQAHFYRNRGFALTELGRLDEAEQAYRDSLKLVPDNATALDELKYIAQLRAGGANRPGGLKPLAHPAPGP